MHKLHQLLQIVALFYVFSFSSLVYAQSTDGTGTAPSPSDPVPTSQGTTLPTSTSTTPAPSENTPVPAPASTTSPRAQVPDSRPATAPDQIPLEPLLPLATEMTTEPLQPETNFNRTTLLAILGSALLAGLVFWVLKTNKKTNSNPCQEIKKQRDAKEQELAEATRRFSLQEVVVEKLREEVEEKEALLKNYVLEQAKNKVLEKTGKSTLSTTVKLAEKTKEAYEVMNERYENAKNLLAILKQTKLKLTGELAALDASYSQCMLQVANSGTEIAREMKTDILAVKNKKITTLLFLHKTEEKKILLAMKKRGFGRAKWNGVGGKLKDAETIPQALVREAKEEIDVEINPDDLTQVATLYFSFKDNFDWNQETHVFFTEKWQGEPSETEEMRPLWHSVASLPYDNMWVDDIHWLPLVLKGQKVNASFVFNKTGDKIIKMKID